MAIIVQKFGGTSVADTDRIRNVAEKVKAEVEKGSQVVVVVSAMAGVTDQLAKYVCELSTLDNLNQCAEHDTVVSSGEQVTVGLLALALHNIGIPARSWLAWQLPIKTDAIYKKARIEAIDTEGISKALTKGEVVVIPGFQGLTDDYRIATLGRGGSDTSAVAVAAALNAERCDIYTDVDGVYTSDPRIVTAARKLKKVGYEEMLEMASLGAKVLQTRSVGMAMKFNVPVQVLSSFSDEPGTLLVNEEQVMERRVITGVTCSRNDVQLTLRDVKNTPGVAAEIFGPVADADVNVDMIVQNVAHDGKVTDVTFTVPLAELDRAKEALEGAKASGKLEYRELVEDNTVAKVSVIGVGMATHSGIAQKMFETLAEKGINILVISTSEIKISVLILDEYTELAMRSLHSAYELDGDVSDHTAE